MKIILIINFVFIGLIGICQSTNSNFLKESIKEPWDGTFQIILADARMVQPEITEDLLTEIENRRDQSEIVFWQYTEYTTIKILPKDLIISEEFKALETFIYAE